VARGAVTPGLIATAALGLIVFTPLFDVWMINLSGLSPELAALAAIPARLIVLLPLLEYWLAFQRSRFIVNGATRFVSFATVTEVGTIGVVTLLCVWHFGLMGAVAGAAGLLAGRSASNLYLHVARRRRRM
jgi:hypothetical protein